MTTNMSECNDNIVTYREPMEGKCARSLGPAGDQKCLVYGGESGGGRIPGGSLDGKDDRHPGDRDLEPDLLGRVDVEDTAVFIIVGLREEVRLQGNVTSEVVLVEANGEGPREKKEGAREQILVNGCDHCEESDVVSTKMKVAENCFVANEIEKAGNDSEKAKASDDLEMPAAKPSRDVEVIEMVSDVQGEIIEFFSQSKVEDNKLQMGIGHYDWLHKLEGDSGGGQHQENGDLSEAYAGMGRGQLGCENGKEQWDVGTAVQDHDEDKVNRVVELKQEKGNKVTVSEVDHRSKWKISHVPADKRSESDQQVELGSEGHHVSLVSSIRDEWRLEVDHKRQLEYANDAVDMKCKNGQQVELGSQVNFMSMAVDKVCLEIGHVKESESSPDVVDEKFKIGHQFESESESEEHHVNLVMVVGDERSFEVDHARESESSLDATVEKSEIHQVKSGSLVHQVNFISTVCDEGCLEEDHTKQPKFSHDAACAKSETDQQVESEFEEHLVNLVSVIGDEDSQGYEVPIDEVKHQEELGLADESDITQDIDSAIIELAHKVKLDSEMKGQLNETITYVPFQIEREATVEDVKWNIDAAVKVESKSEREEIQSETFIIDVDGHLEQKWEPSTDPVAENNQERSEQVVPYYELDKEHQDSQQISDIQEMEPAAESELQHCHVVAIEKPSNVTEDAPIAESGEKQKIQSILFNSVGSGYAYTENVEPSLGVMVHNLSSENLNIRSTFVTYTNLDGYLEPNENQETMRTSDSIKVVDNAEAESADSLVVHDPDIGIAGEIARTNYFNQLQQDICSTQDINDEKCSPKLEGASGTYAEPSHVNIDSSFDAFVKDGDEFESRYNQSEQSYCQSGIVNVDQYCFGNQFIKFGEIVVNLDEACIPESGPFFIIKLPRFTGDELWTKIQQAQDEVDERTSTRDLIYREFQKQKAIYFKVSEELATVGLEELAAIAAFDAKLGELNCVHSMLNMLNQARSLEEIDAKIKEMEFNHQHLTMPLKEKKFMQEVKQLRCECEQLLSIMGSKNEIDKALKEENSIDHKLKDLKKDLDSLRSNLAQAKEKAIIARKRCDDEEIILQNIRKQYNAANVIRQNTFSRMQHLKKESFEKSKYFHKYKNDQTTAKSYASSGDLMSLWLHCSSQVENIMNLWNKDDEFRKQYVECNKNSVLRRRLKTLDARSLGPDEKQMAPSNVNKYSTMTVEPSAEVSQPVIPLAVEEKQEKIKAKELPPAPPKMVQKNQPAKPRKSNVTTSRKTRNSTASTVPIEETTSIVPDTELIENTEDVKSMTKEEEVLVGNGEELTRKEEVLKKEKEAAELKERLKLEQRVKAKEAEERKKRQAEKAQARAEYRAKREAEFRERKRAKKEKKKVSVAVDAAQVDNKEVTVSTVENNQAETFQEQQSEAPAATCLKRTSRHAVLAKKYNRAQPLPLPLRNRGKRKMHTWTWALLTAVLLIVLVLSGYISTPTLSLPGLGF